MNHMNYSKSSLSLIRFLCINGILVELLCIIRLFILKGSFLDISGITNIMTFLQSDLLNAIVHFTTLAFFIFLLFFPQYICYIGFLAFLYSIKIIIIDTLAAKPIGQLLYFIGISSFLFLGYYKNQRIFKIAASILFNMILISTNARFGAIVCINSYIVSLGYSLALLLCTFFTTNFLRLVLMKKTARVWDLSQYPDLTQRDKEWLKQILDEKGYDEIATSSGVTVGTLKNRMHQIFNVVGIEDRVNLLATYSGYEVKF